MQKELAEKAKLPQSTISNIESGARGMPDYQRARVAAALGIDPSVLDPAATPELDLDGLLKQLGSQPSEQTLNATSVPDRRLPSKPTPPGLEGFLERHPEIARRKRIRWYLENQTFRLEPWVELDDKFWAEQAAFWERYLSEVDAEGRAPGPRAPRKG